MKKVLFLIMILIGLFILGCVKSADESFESILDDAQSYVCEGVMESFFDQGKKETNFKVCFKKPSYLKVEFGSEDNNQVVVKNEEGVYILIPAVNKNFKIDSSWPNNASYPYLLESIKSDLSKEGLTKTENENSYTYQTTSKLFNDGVETKQLITLDKATNLPIEVIVYDQNDEVYIRISFTKIELNKEINDKEFEIETIMQELRKEELTVFSQREFLLPSYIPEGCSTNNDNTLVTGTDDELVSIMKFTGNSTFTIIQEYINDSEVLSTTMSSGEIMTFLGNIGIYKGESIEVYCDGIMYTLASDSLNSTELIKIMSSYFTTPEK